MNSINGSKIVVWITIIQFIFTMIFYLYTVIKISNAHTPEPDRTFVKKTQQYVQDLKSNYQQKSDLYQQKIDSLNTKLLVTEAQLNKAKASARRDRSILDEMLKQKWDTLSPQDKAWACDTLRDQVEHYLFTSAKKDTLYEQKITELEKIEENLTKQLVTCDTTQERLAQKLEQSLQQNKAVAKELKKQKRKRNFLRVGAAVLGGIAVFLAIK